MFSRLATQLSFFAILGFAGVAWAASLFPQIHVDFQHPVIVGSHTLAPGHYTFQKVQGTSQVPVFRVTDSKGNNITLTQVALHSRKESNGEMNPESVHQNSNVVLQKIGGKYYLDKIWVAGRRQSWDFEIPESVKAQGGMQQEVVPAS